MVLIGFGWSVFWIGVEGVVVIDYGDLLSFGFDDEVFEYVIVWKGDDVVWIEWEYLFVVFEVSMGI